MRTLRALWLRLFHRPEWDADFTAELESHIAMHIEDGIRAGLSPEEARRQALMRLGGADQARQAYRERATLTWLETVRHDLRYALRGLRRNPVFAATAIVTLALGIGAATAVFSVVDRILFRPLPYSDSDRLVSVGLVQSMERQEFTLGGFFYEWRDNEKPFESMTFERGVEECNVTENHPVQLECARVAQNFLATLGIRLQLGRNFVPEEDAPHGPKSVLISDALWVGRYGRDPSVLGKSINLDEQAYQIIGVLPRDFEMPRLQKADVLVAAQTDIAAQHTVNSGIGYPMWAFARLKPGISIEQAKAEMQPLYRHTWEWIPVQLRNEFRLQVRSLRDRQMQDAYVAARVLLGAVLAVLLIACANVAGLFAGRSVARQREMAVRSALGASRTRLVRQTMTEALLLSGAGALAGCLIAEILLHVFMAIAPAGIPFLKDARLDFRVIGFTVFLALVSAAAFGMVPALERPRTSALGSRSTGTRSQARVRRALVAVQIAASVVLLTGAGLLIKSFRNLENQSLGMQSRNVLTVRLPITAQRYPTLQSSMDLHLRAEAALRRVPGVTAVGISDSVPPDEDSWHTGERYADIFVNGKEAAAPGTGGNVLVRTVTPEYFRVLQIPIVKGRNFTDQERQTGGDVLIVSQLLASRLFPGEDPVGQHIQFAGYLPYFAMGKRIFTVIGVAGNVKNAGLAGQDQPEYYSLRDNHPTAWGSHIVMVLETELPMPVITRWVQSEIAQIDPMIPVEIVPLSESVVRLADRPRFQTALLTFFACVGLLMAVIGLYGVLAFIAAQRTQEIGIRMALGATRADVLRLIGSESIRLIALGGAAGIAASLASVQVLRSLLFHVDPRDPVSLIAIALFLAVVSMVATIAPARAAMRTNPVEALRTE